ncbi:MAG: biopolymer transporter ExbD [Candidatus Eisenbacteria bacterium]|uniref:Biopolymer transporter ExbD n=1 Tax=Eiseniibacteriota bacterium TaxID=2212470 RepID=A0A956M2Q9_UNCEI|nr:biopolymer transporter ExbD [Candidatus Eisenbacteria bacterium]
MKTRLSGSRSAPARRGGPAERLPLTSMVDMMTILIVFLLQSFSDDGSLLTPAAGVALPVATSGERPWSTISIEVTEGEIRVDGAPVCTLEEVQRSDETTIPGLARALARSNGATAGFDAAGKSGTEDADASRRVLIQCDREREFALLKKVLRTCSEAGYESPGLLVERSGS